MTSDARARTRVEAIITLPQNVGRMRIGSLFQDDSSSSGNNTLSFLEENLQMRHARDFS